MKSNNTNSIKSAAMGIAVGAAVCAAGAYAMQKHPKEVKKAVKKVSHTANKAMGGIDKIISARG